jgi:hypothetical protein
LILALAAVPALAQRQLSWRPLAVEARLDAEGVLWVRESHTMVFTGAWNGGERIFRLRQDQTLELLALARVDPESGEEVSLVEGGLSRVDHYEWTNRKTLRWRSRLPSDPPFDQTPITYVIEYRQERMLQPSGDRYLMDHDFAFPDRRWPIEVFTLELELDPVWQPAAPLATSHGPVDLGSAGGFLVTADLEYLGEGVPAGVRRLPPVGLRAVAFLGAVLAILALLVGFRRREAALGRFDPPPAPTETIDTAWLEEHLFSLLPEEAGALWDRTVGPPEVAAILARWEAEGRIESEVVPRPSRFKRDVLRLKLTAHRNSFAGYESKLLGKLFFDGLEEVDTEAIRQKYRRRGFDPAATVRRGVERGLRRHGKDLEPHKTLPGRGKLVTLGLFYAFLALMALEAIGRPLMTLQLALLLLVPVVVLYLLLGLIFAYVYRGRLTRLGWWSLGFLLPSLGFYALMAGAAFFDRLLPGIDFAPQPGIAGTVALAVLAVLVWSSVLNNARCRERVAGLARRQRLAAARRLFAAQLRRQQPALLDGWMPYLLALGLGPGVDRWWRRFGGVADLDALPASRFGSMASGSTAGSWTGGGGSFGGAGATASWAAVAGSIASGVAKPSSSGSGGGSGGGSSGGGSSGGGGGGGW